jgi:putative Mn2+ efflux pump MntP
MIYFNGLLLGIGLGSDAFSVALADGLSQKANGKKLTIIIPLVFGLCQGAMSLIGYLIALNLVSSVKIIEKIIPFLALILLLTIGIKTIIDATKRESVKINTLTPLTIISQGIATSIDALSVGFTITGYALTQALTVCTIISVVTFILCLVGVYAGKKFGKELTGIGGIISGIILIIIGLEIFVKNLFF